MDRIHEEFEIVSHSFTDVIVRIDGTLLRDEQYVKLNREQYYVAINSWLGLILDLGCKEAEAHFLSYMRKNGLLATIDLACQTADYCISVAAGEVVKPTPEQIALESSFHTNLRDTLQALRYLKRFTPASEVLLQRAADKFIALQDRLNWRKQDNVRTVDPSRIPPYDITVLAPMRKWFNTLLSGLYTYWECMTGSFSNGSSRDGKTLIDKIKGLGKYKEGFDWPYYPIDLNPVSPVTVHKPPVLDVQSVPKNYKQGRLIAPEDAFTVWECQRWRKALELRFLTSEFRKYVNVLDQRRQQELAFDGTVECWCTLDCSMASDSIARYNMRYVMDDKVWKEVQQYLPTDYRVNGKKVHASTFLTSGNPMTFNFETAFFWCAAMAARDIHNGFTGELGAFPSAYGDDLIVDAKYVDETIMVLDRLHIEVNVSKSFTSGKYRESCGAEYYDQEPVHSKYWPRAQILTGRQPTADDYGHLVALQHRVYDYPHASEFLSWYVRDIWSHTTTSQPGLLEAGLDVTQDLWGVNINPLPSKQHPYGKYWDENVAKDFVYHDEYGRNYGHTCQHVIPEKAGAKSASDYAAVQMFLYQQFLREGPWFPTELDRKLGVSSRREATGVWSEPKSSVKIIYNDF